LDAKSLLESLLATGKDLAEKGAVITEDLVKRGAAAAEELVQKGGAVAKDLSEKGTEAAGEYGEKAKDMAEDKLGVPEAGPERDAMLSGLGKGAAIGGILALLLGTKSGRKVTGTAVKVGTLAALGTFGYKAYQKWQQQHGGSPELGSPIGDLVDADANRRSMAIIKAMIAAAKADGHIDADEIAAIKKQMESLGLEPDVATMLQEELAKPLSADEVAAHADSPAAAVEMYLASKMLIDAENEADKDYLDRLATALDLPSSVVDEVASEAM
jgi:uncharacterized membrane protein YebE (DUF533 family)